MPPDNHILILNGSPREHGLLSRLLYEMELAASGHAQIKHINVHKLNFAACQGCMSCRTSRKCRLPYDDAHMIAKVLSWADILIVASPCYWGNMNGKLKMLFDRLVYMLIDTTDRCLPIPLHKKERALIVTTCSTPFPFNIWFNQSYGTVKAIKSILKWSGYKVIGNIQRSNTLINNTLTEHDQRKCRQLIYKTIKSTIKS